LTAYKYGKTLKAESTLVLPYNIHIEHPPYEVGLTLLADLMEPTKQHITVLVYNSTINFSEPIQSWLDAQL
jgi:hypothetical protein